MTMSMSLLFWQTVAVVMTFSTMSLLLLRLAERQVTGVNIISSSANVLNPKVKNDKHLLDFRALVGDFPPTSMDVPFPFDEKDVMPFIRAGVCPDKMKCKNLKSNTTSPPWTIHGDLEILVDNEKIITLDTASKAYLNAVMEARSFSFTNFLGVPLQQDPNDAFVIMDLLWRLKPDLLIEFGTAGGGSAFFYGVIMSGYNPHAHVITIDPKRTFDWNQKYVRKACPHCIYARNTPFWKDSGVIEFYKEYPANMMHEVEEKINRWKSKTILIIDDSNHEQESVLSNIAAYAKYVTPGSYLIVQDTKMSMGSTDSGPEGAIYEFLKTDIGKQFEVDRRFEYYFISEHANGFLRRKTN